MKPQSLTFKAGKGALDLVRKQGFDAEAVGTIAGASGGAKWLVLSRLDRAILETVVPKLRGPVHLIGTSIGAWRFACYGQADPIAAISRFEEAYVSQTYSEAPDIHEISAKTREILAVLLGAHGVEEILGNRLFRTHVMAVRCRHLTASENRWVLGMSLLAAATLNSVSRRSLGLFFERALFYDSRERPPFFEANGFPLQRVALAENNFADSIVATGAIPLVLSGVVDIAGAERGMYRDGGLIDYHHDLPHSADDRLTLYPHFYDYMVPGWFDKKFSWRRPQESNVERTILISPSREFVSRLPNGKIPDRQDFLNYSSEERVAAWRQCVAACDELADELHEVLERDQLPARLQPLYP